MTDVKIDVTSCFFARDLVKADEMTTIKQEMKTLELHIKRKLTRNGKKCLQN